MAAAPRSTSSSRTTTPRARHVRPTPPPTTSRPRSTRRRGRAPAWRALPFDERAAIFLRAADLLAGPWRADAERRHDARPVQVRAAGRDRRRLRADRLPALQRALRPADPRRAAGARRRACGTGWTTARWRASSTRSRRSTSPPSPATCRPSAALMGNVVVWKPSPTQQFAAHSPCACWRRPGCPPGVINMVTGNGLAVSRGRADPPGPGRHPLHRLDRDLPAPVADGRREHRRYRAYPRLVGETGGKDFVVAHPSADPARADDRAGPRRVRVPGPEVLGRLPGVRAPLASGTADPRRAGRRRAESLTVRRRHRPVELHRRRHRRAGVRQAQGARIDRAKQAPSLSRSLAGGATDDARAGSSTRPC